MFSIIGMMPGRSLRHAVMMRAAQDAGQVYTLH